VENNDVRKLDRWLRSWSRVRCVRAGRRLLDVARSFGHVDVVRLLETHEHVNEFVCATFASDVARIMEVLALGEGTGGWTDMASADEHTHTHTHARTHARTHTHTHGGLEAEPTAPTPIHTHTDTT